MKKIFIIIIATVVVAMLAIISFGTDVFTTPYWETETEFGMWQDELIIEFADGSSQSFKIIEEGRDKPFTVFYGDEEITSMSLKLSAKATGEGYEGAEIKTTNFGYDGTIMKQSPPPVELKHTWSSHRNDGTTTVSLDSTKTLVNTGINLDAEINNNPSEYPQGIYSIRFDPKGTVQYRGYPDGGSWETATLPPYRVATVAVIPSGGGGQIVVTLYSEIRT